MGQSTHVYHTRWEGGLWDVYEAMMLNTTDCGWAWNESLNGNRWTDVEFDLLEILEGNALRKLHHCMVIKARDHTKEQRYGIVTANI